MAPEWGPPVGSTQTSPGASVLSPTLAQTIRSHSVQRHWRKHPRPNRSGQPRRQLPLHGTEVRTAGLSATRSLRSRPGGQCSGIASSSLEFRPHLGISFCPQRPSQVLPLPPEPSARGSPSSRRPTSAQAPKAHRLFPGAACQFLHDTLTVSPDLPPGTFTSHPFQPGLSSGSPTHRLPLAHSPPGPPRVPACHRHPQHKSFRDKGHTSQPGLTSEERQSLGAQ